MTDLNRAGLAKNAREKTGLSQEDFGRILMVSRYAIWSWESGVSSPSKYEMELLLAISNAHSLPCKKTIKDALIVGGAPLALFLMLKEIYGKERK